MNFIAVYGRAMYNEESKLLGTQVLLEVKSLKNINLFYKK